MAITNSDADDAIRICDRSILSGDAQRLIQLLDRELSASYSSENMHTVDFGPFHGEGGIFVIAYVDESPVGCGALRPINDVDTELKRMFVVKSHRGQGISRRILNHLENRSREEGFKRILLETGNQQTAAIRLYESVGYERVDPFGEYVGSPVSVCFRKNLMS